MAKKSTSLKAAKKAPSVFSSGSTIKSSKAAAGSALSQVKPTKVTSKKAATTASKHMVTPMLHPNQFYVNEAWIAFHLNDAPIQTGLDGNFYCIALMDAASCFILNMTILPNNEAEQSKFEAKLLLKNAYAQTQVMPKTLFIPSDMSANSLALEAERQKITVVRVPEHQLLLFIGEAREGFKEHFAGGSPQ